MYGDLQPEEGKKRIIIGEENKIDRPKTRQSEQQQQHKKIEEKIENYDGKDCALQDTAARNDFHLNCNLLEKYWSHSLSNPTLFNRKVKSSTYGLVFVVGVSVDDKQQLDSPLFCFFILVYIVVYYSRSN